MADESLIERAAPIGATTANYTNSGSGNLIAHANTVNIYKSDCDAQPQPPQIVQTKCNRMILNSLSHEMYSIFILEDEHYGLGTFSIPADACLKHTSPDLIHKYRRIDEAAQRDIKRMPAILANKNHGQKVSDEWQFFYLAKIDSIVMQGAALRIEFSSDGSCYRQQALNEHCEELGLLCSSLRTELDEIHWAIKEGDLLGKLEELDILSNGR